MIVVIEKARNSEGRERRGNKKNVIKIRGMCIEPHDARQNCTHENKLFR